MKTGKITITKKIIAALTVIALLINTATAQPLSTSPKSLPDEPLSVKYIGTEDEYLVFEITVIADGSKHSVLNIADKNTGTLYSEQLKGNSSIQTIKIEKKDEQMLSFQLVNDKNIYYKNFNINTSTIVKTTVQESGLAIR